MTARPALMHTHSIDVSGAGLLAGPMPANFGDSESMPLLGTGGSIDYVRRSRPLGASAAPSPTPIPPSEGPVAWRGAPRHGARREPKPFARYFGHPAPDAQATAHLASGPALSAARLYSRSTAPARPQPGPQTPPVDDVRPASQRLAAKSQSSVPALQIASHPPTPQAHNVSAVLPSFALHGYEDINSALPSISKPLVSVSVSAHARATARLTPPSTHSIYQVARQQSARTLQCHLAQEPNAVTLWHPNGYNLLHHVVRQRSLEHVNVVLQAMGQLPRPARAMLLDGVADDGLDSIRIAIKQHSAFVLAKLLQAGCDPTRRRYRQKPWLVARMSRPLQPYWRIEDAALYAMRKHNVNAVDLLLLWDERHVMHNSQSPYTFDLEALMAMATSVDHARLRHAMIDVLHAARRRRTQMYDEACIAQA